MNERQQKLVSKLNQIGRWASQLEVCLLIDDYRLVMQEHPKYGTPLFQFHDCKARLTLTKDIRDINNDIHNGVVILSDTNRGIKIANNDEIIQYAEKLKIHALKKLSNISKIIKKCQLNNQLNMDEVDAFLKNNS